MIKSKFSKTPKTEKFLLNRVDMKALKEQKMLEQVNQVDPEPISASFLITQLPQATKAKSNDTKRLTKMSRVPST